MNSTNPISVSRPCLVVRVGVTGHRDLAAEDATELASRVRGVLQAVIESAQAIVADGASGYAAEAPQMRVISSLAEGADRLVAREAMALPVAPRVALQCPLPFPRETYALDFDSVESKAEFAAMLSEATAVLEMDGQRSETQAPFAYLRAGQMMLAQCDVLIAIWDGQPPNADKLGGTAFIVAEAQAQSLPVIWLPTTRRGEIALRLGGGAKPASTTTMDDWRIGLRRRLDEVLRRPQSSHKSHDDPGLTPGEFLACLDEQRPERTFLGNLWRLFVRGLSFGAPSNDNPTVSKAAIAAVPEIGRPQAVDPFAADHASGRRPAARYAGLYRGAFLVNYTLGALAVWLALLVVAVPKSWERGLFVAELATIITIIAQIRIVKVRRWHPRSIDCRLYAEQLRQMRYLWPLGQVTPSSGPPAHASFGDPRSTIMNWRFRAALREAGMPAANLTREYLMKCLDLILGDWLGGPRGQIRYHQSLAASAAAIDHRLHEIAWWCFALTAVGCAAHLIPQLEHVRVWLTVAAGGLPAVAAAAHAIANRGEFHRISQRSHAMAARLTETLHELDQLAERAEGFTSVDLQRAIEPACIAMMDEVIDWRILYSKPPISPG